MYIPVDGDIYLADIPHEAHLQSGRCPVIIAQNVKGNASNDSIHMIPLTSKIHKATSLPTHVLLHSNDQNGLKCDSVALVEDCRPLQKSCFIRRIGKLSLDERKKIGEAFRIHIPLAG